MLYIMKQDASWQPEGEPLHTATGQPFLLVLVFPWI